ncbi:enoyl-CoA hydratase/isomerase family protein [Thermodesulfobacteriota bacterium]
MKEDREFNETCYFFTAERLDNVVIIRFRENMLFNITDLSARDTVLDYLDRVSKNDLIKAVIILSSPKNRGQEEYRDFYHQLSKMKGDVSLFHRLCNVVDQFILKIVGLNKIVIHANSGNVISLFLNVSLACDYRIAADNTVFQNPYLDLGLLPKGGGPFFLSKRLGISKAYEILLFRREITAHEALKLGIIDEVVPIDDLEEAAFEAAQRFIAIPFSTLSGIKKLINYSIHDLKSYLELENGELLKIVEPSFWK